MPCKAPIPAYRPAQGGPIHFNYPKDGRAYTPIDIPCGTCILCREEYARQTAVRIHHEATLYDESCFLTLTYAAQHIPQYNSLNYTHLIKFWKRLRKDVGKLRYYAVGEYGTRSQRPHYHACIFGHAFIKNRIIVEETPHLLWTTPKLEKIWGLGNVRVGALNFETARYTASYITKKLRSKQQYVRVDEETGELIALVQPRAFMSRNIGKEWWGQWHNQVDEHDYVVINGRRQKPPKAYDKWLGEANKQKLEEIKTKRKEKAVRETKEQTHARAENAHARARQKSKSI